MTENPYRASLALLGRRGQHWTQGALHRRYTTWYGRQVDAYCLVGALHEVVVAKDSNAVIKGLALGPDALVRWNDRRSRTWGEVRALLLQAAEIWDQQQAVVEMPPPPSEPEPVVPMPPVPQGVLVGIRKG